MNNNNNKQQVIIFDLVEHLSKGNIEEFAAKYYKFYEAIDTALKSGKKVFISFEKDKPKPMVCDDPSKMEKTLVELLQIMHDEQESIAREYMEEEFDEENEEGEKKKEEEVTQFIKSTGLLKFLDEVLAMFASWNDMQDKPENTNDDGDMII
jgi:hypothetical protein